MSSIARRPNVKNRRSQVLDSERTIRPSFTLLSTTPRNPIIAQRQFQHRWCIPSDLANLRIKDPAVLLARLDDIFGSRHSLRYWHPSLKDIMLDCINKGYDLGMAYGMLRRWWSHPSPDLLSHFKLLENKDRERREAAVVDGLIKDVRMPPRRVWDLYSNRVLPFWAVDMTWSHGVDICDDIGAVSHAWMSPGQRINKDTPINGHQWPVPIPRDVDLDNLRIELLNLQSERWIEYAWLDVLCLRQRGGPLEERLLAKEWEIDVPTIGTIYEHCLYTVLYLNGLGRPFEENDLDDARHWCNRAWTVQEWCCGERGWLNTWEPVLGGITKQSPHFKMTRTQTYGYNDFTNQLADRMNETEALAAQTSIIKAAVTMGRRQAERDVDRLAGLAYLACGETQPVFDTTKLVDDAWLPFIDCMTPLKRGQLFFLFPTTGDRDYEWAPSWNQLLRNAEEPLANVLRAELRHGDLDQEYCPTLSMNWTGAAPSSRKHVRLALHGNSASNPNGKGGYSCLVVCLPNCRLDGFDSPGSTFLDTVGRKIRRGTVSFDVRRDCRISFDLIACHSHPIPSGRYCLVAARNDKTWYTPIVHPCCYWVVGLLDEAECFHKISVLEVENEQFGFTSARHVRNEKLIKELSLSDSEEAMDSSPWVRRVKLA